MPIAFEGSGTPLTTQDITNARITLGGDMATLWALVTVETQGFGFLADRRPRILFERQIFHRRTNGQYDRVDPSISGQVPGGYLGGAAEYRRLARAMSLDEQAALESTSWGLGQVMGYNAAPAGFSDVYAMVTAMVATESAQLEAATSFIIANLPLCAAFRTHNWAALAFHYNGPDYARNHYDVRLKQYFDRFSTAANCPDIGVRTTQACLYYLGYLPDGVDGLMGPVTRAAIMTFRLRQGLPATEADADVMRLLSAEAAI